MKFSDPNTLAFSSVWKIKALLNQLWVDHILYERENCLTLMAAYRGHLLEAKAVELPTGISNSSVLLGRIGLLEVLIQDQTKAPRLLEIATALWITSSQPAQKEFSELVIKLDKEAESLWLQPEHLAEIRAEKVLLLSKKILTLGAKTYAIFHASSQHEIKQVSYGT